MYKRDTKQDRDKTEKENTCNTVYMYKERV